MIRSMTGFGRGVATRAGLNIAVEIKTVNHRYLDVVLRSPRSYTALEAAWTKRIEARLLRGRVEVHVSRTSRGGDVRVVPDAQVYAAWTGAIRALAGDGVLGEADIARAALERPGVLTVEEVAPDTDGEAEVVLQALEQALDGVVAMREAEGRALHADLAAGIAQMHAEVDALHQVVDDLDARLLERLRARIARLVGDGVDEARLLAEAGVLAEKADVAEELARMRSHLAQLDEALHADGTVGRRLEFILQEVHREVNTMGAKVVDDAASRRVVELKGGLERLREQAANVA